MHKSPIFEVLTKLETPSRLDLSGKPLDALESLFELSRSYKKEFRELIEELIQTTFWQSQDYPSNPYPTLCLELASLIDSHYGKLGHPEPAYHSRKHFQDVCLALTALLQQSITLADESEHHNLWEISSEEAWVLLFCAIAHDFGHDGSTNKTPFELEKSSIEKARTFLRGSSSEPDFIKALETKIEPIILATDPSFFSTLLAKCTELSAKPAKTDYMSMLLVEADLLASVLPKRGEALGKLLGQEWGSSNPKAAAIVASNQGRLKFLEYIRFISPYAIMLKMEDIRHQSIEELKG